MDNGYHIQQRLVKVSRYNRWLYESFRLHLGSRILDAGCGFGNITEFMLDGKDLIIGVDKSAAFYEAVRQRFAHRANFVPVLGDIGDREVLAAVKPYGIDTVVCVNVLQQIEDDVGALGAFREVLLDGGTLILLVPALQFLFGSMDAADRHVRRYSRADVTRKLLASGFSIHRIRWMNVLGIPGWLLNGRILRRGLIPASHYAAYDRVVPVLRMVESRFPVPVGLSLLCVARKAKAT